MKFNLKSQKYESFCNFAVCYQTKTNLLNYKKMKKFVKLFALAVMLIVGSQAVAQTRGTMFLGASFPMKDYADFDGFNEFALTTHDEDDGGAGIGFNAGLKWYFNVGVQGLGVMLSLDGLYNGPCESLKTAYRDAEVQMGNQYAGSSFSYSSKPKYINVPAMLGLNYIFRFNPNLGVFVEAGAGGNLRFITEMETISKQEVLGLETKTVTTNTYDKAFSFAYQVGAGIEVARNLVVGCSFYDLGKANVNMNETKKIVSGNSNPSTFKDYKPLGTVRPVMILARIGFSF